MDLGGTTVVVTGAGHGIGRAMARRFAADGAAHVVVADLDGEAAEKVAAELDGGLGARIDVSHENEIADLIERVEHDVAPIDLFCSNAGIITIGGEEAPDEDWRRIIDINVMAHVWGARHMVPRMLERGGGYLLNTASAAGLLTQIGSAPYSVTKHAAVAFAEWLAITHGDQGLKVSVLCPQAVRTAMTGFTEGGGVAGVDGMLEPDDVAAVVAEGLADERFLILPHPEVREYFKRKGDDYERWLRGMRRLQSRYFMGIRRVDEE
jgi:NAD(P)-dependent dehydrogenase (short-subunit alcohol dehydrogenase family)